MVVMMKGVTIMYNDECGDNNDDGGISGDVTNVTDDYSICGNNGEDGHV